VSFWKGMAPALVFVAAIFVVPELFGFKLTNEHFQWILIIFLMASLSQLWSRQPNPPTTWKEEFLDRLLWAEPIEPAHQRASIDARNLPNDPALPAFLEVTQDFADVVNESLKESRWRLQEDGLVINDWDEGSYRRYKIFHAQEEVGVVKFSNLGFGDHYIDVHLRWARFFTAISVRDFLRRVGNQVCTAENGLAVANERINVAMLDAVWQALQFGSFYPAGLRLYREGVEPTGPLPSSLNDDPGELDVSFSGDYTVWVNHRNEVRARIKSRDDKPAPNTPNPISG
jgi:hypothetical protein